VETSQLTPAKFPVAPTEGLLFVEPRNPPNPAGIVLLDPRKAWRGEVKAAGAGCECKVGDIVHLKPTQAIEAVFHRSPVWIVRDESVLAVES
jgi:hypothetical protein